MYTSQGVILLPHSKIHLHILKHMYIKLHVSSSWKSAPTLLECPCIEEMMSTIEIVCDNLKVETMAVVSWVCLM